MLELEKNEYAQLMKDADLFFKKLFPICRSITGNGVRKTLSILQEIVGFDIKEIPSGTECYDWIIPDEWNIKDAYIKDPSGNRVVDFQRNNLHVVNYSSPLDKILSFKELQKHLYTLPDMPEAIPYRTSYYNKDWGFCLSQKQLDSMNKEIKYHVKIESTLKPGNLTYGESYIKGTSGKEYLISSYCCHPSLANDNLSGITLWAFLLKKLSKIKTFHSYRFILVPETIGAIAYLKSNEPLMKTVNGGFVITSVAGPGEFGYKSSFIKNHLIDRVVRKTFQELDEYYIEYPFHVTGSDETSYSSPFFRIPVGTICKDKYFEYPYYHTSLDNLEFISAKNLIKTLRIYLHAIEMLERNITFASMMPYCEAMLGKRGLYPKVGGHYKQNKPCEDAGINGHGYEIKPGVLIPEKEIDAMLWLMFYIDGKTSLFDISQKIDIPMKQLYEISQKLVQAGLIKPIT